MGTSRNDRSPSTPAWKPALAVLGRPEVPIEHQAAEIWRAASQDRGEHLLRDLSNPALAKTYSLLFEARDAERALHAFDEITARTTGAGLALEWGRRALLRCIGQGLAPVSFPAQLLGEAVAYYVARDLPSFVAAHNRVPSVSEAVKLKDQIRSFVTTAVGELRPPPSQDADSWKRFIETALGSLRERKPRK